MSDRMPDPDRDRDDDGRSNEEKGPKNPIGPGGSPTQKPEDEDAKKG